MLRERHWFEDDDDDFPVRVYENRRKLVLPNKLVADYYKGDTHKYWVFYYTAEQLPSVESEPDRLAPVESTYDNSSLAWVAAKHEELYKLYPNQWILVENRAVSAHSSNLRELENTARERGLGKVFITKVVPVPKTTRLIYATQVL